MTRTVIQVPFLVPLSALYALAFSSYQRKLLQLARDEANDNVNNNSKHNNRQPLVHNGFECEELLNEIL